MEYINGKLEVELINYTREADKLLVFSKNTRHLNGKASWDELSEMSTVDFDEQLNYALGSIGSALEFVDYTFLLSGVTRAMTHQLVRHRVGVSFAQQSMRLTKAGVFGYMIPDEINKDRSAKTTYINAMCKIQESYDDLMEDGGRTQDIRGILPTNILTNILMKINLRALAELLNVRLCIRAQGEFQEVAKLLQAKVVKVHPWAAKILGVNCLIHGRCKYPLFRECPISKANPELLGLSAEKSESIRKCFEKVSGFDPQPKTNVDKDSKDEKTFVDKLSDAACAQLVSGFYIKGEM
jgi:thymidylate synthase (FAD)